MSTLHTRVRAELPPGSGELERVGLAEAPLLANFRG